MTIFISNISALYLLLGSRDFSGLNVVGCAGQQLRKTRAVPRPGSRPSYKVVERNGLPFGVPNGPLHVNVADASSRSDSRLLISHVMPENARGTYLRVDDCYCVLSPEACFVDLASDLSFPHLVELGYLLCGTYAPESLDQLTRHYGLERLTSTSRIGAYLEKVGGRHGVKAARRALRYIADGSASPMETKIAIQLCLPTTEGGYGFPLPVLNSPVETKHWGLAGEGCMIRKPDLLWPGKGVSIEFDGRAYHSSEERMEADLARRNELESRGIHGFTARSACFRDALSVQAFATQVAAPLGKSLHSMTTNLARKRYELFQELFGRKRWELGSQTRESGFRQN